MMLLIGLLSCLGAISSGLYILKLILQTRKIELSSNSKLYRVPGEKKLLNSEKKYEVVLKNPKETSSLWQFLSQAFTKITELKIKYCTDKSQLQPELSQTTSQLSKENGCPWLTVNHRITVDRKGKIISTDESRDKLPVSTHDNRDSKLPASTHDNRDSKFVAVERCLLSFDNSVKWYTEILQIQGTSLQS